jgi:hypothetical protein
MSRTRRDRPVQRVVERVLPLVPVGKPVGKSDFEMILAEVVACVREKTDASPKRLRALTAKVLGDLPNEYGRLDERDRSWPALIAYLYTKYLHELAAAE